MWKGRKIWRREALAAIVSILWYQLAFPSRVGTSLEIGSVEPRIWCAHKSPKVAGRSSR